MCLIDTRKKIPDDDAPNVIFGNCMEIDKQEFSQLAQRMFLINYIEVKMIVIEVEMTN